MKYKVRIKKQPSYQKGGRTIGDFSNLTEDQLENGLVYGFRPEPLNESRGIQQQNTMGDLEAIPLPQMKIPTPIDKIPSPIVVNDLKQKYTGVSIVDYLNQLGLPTSRDFRKKLANNFGIKNYTGTAKQNAQLIDIINNQNNAFINLGGKAVQPVKKQAVVRPEWYMSPYAPTPIHFPSVPSDIQQREGMSAEDMKNAVALQIGALLPEVSFTRTYPFPKGLPGPRPVRPIQIPGPRNLPGKPFTGWTSGSGFISPFQMGGTQDDSSAQIIQIIKTYAQAKGVDEKQLFKKLQQLNPEEQKQTIMQMYQELQSGDGGSEDMGYDMPTAAYGGQMGYGLDLGARRLWMNQNDDEESDVNRNIEEVPREEANIEAEGGETVVLPTQNNDYNHFNIKGKRHTQGGVPLNVPEGSFVFSDTKKMKMGGPVLSLFGKSAKSSKKYTPADIAKQYDLNKYKAILEDSRADAIKKRTAELMIQNYEKKLAQLALVQEGKKGFPQGIPEIAEDYYNKMTGASEKESQDESQEREAMYGGSMRYGGGLYKAQNGTSTGVPYIYNKPEYTQDDLLGINNKNPEYGYGKPFVSYSEPTIPYDDKWKDKQISSDPTKPNDDEKAAYVRNMMYANSKIPTGYNKEHLGNMFTAGLVSALRKTIYPVQGSLKLATPETYYVDPSRGIAAIAEQNNALRQANAQFSGPQSRYNSTYAAGQSGSNIANLIGQYANQNAGIGNQASMQANAIQNKQREGDYESFMQYNKDLAAAEQQRINTKISDIMAINQARGLAEVDRRNKNMVNFSNPYFYYDANGVPVFKGAHPMYDFYNRRSNSNMMSPENFFNYAKDYDKDVKWKDYMDYNRMISGQPQYSGGMYGGYPPYGVYGGYGGYSPFSY